MARRFDQAGGQPAQVELAVPQDPERPAAFFSIRIVGPVIQRHSPGFRLAPDPQPAARDVMLTDRNIRGGDPHLVKQIIAGGVVVMPMRIDDRERQVRHLADGKGQIVKPIPGIDQQRLPVSHEQRHVHVHPVGEAKDAGQQFPGYGSVFHGRIPPRMSGVFMISTPASITMPRPCVSLNRQESER